MRNFDMRQRRIGGGRTVHARTNAILRRIGALTQPIGVEVGVFTGTMSRALLNGHQGLHLYMVDNWLAEEAQPASYRASEDYHSRLSVRKQQRYQARARAITQCYAARRTILVLSSVVAATCFEDGQCDFVFLDADHSYTGVRTDITVWWPKIRPGGWLCGHDYGGWTYVGPEREKRYFGVKHAADEAAERLDVALTPDADYTFFMDKPE
jgi:hypothetical protein